MRTTKAQVIRAFHDLASAAGLVPVPGHGAALPPGSGPDAASYNTPGAWALDNAPHYGGITIEETINPGGGVVTLGGAFMNANRMPPAQFVQACRLATAVLDRALARERADN